MKLAKAQQNVVEEIRKYIGRFDTHNGDPNYKIEKFEIKAMEYGNVICVYSEAGRIGKDGNIHFLCKTIRQIFIGKKGGISGYQWIDGKRDPKKHQGFMNVMHNCAWQITIN